MSEPHGFDTSGGLASSQQGRARVTMSTARPDTPGPTQRAEHDEQLGRAPRRRPPRARLRRPRALTPADDLASTADVARTSRVEPRPHTGVEHPGTHDDTAAEAA